jgi:hypothetical protein
MENPLDTQTEIRPLALDLTRTVPRSPFDEIEGFAWLPRLIDKTRAHHAGTAGDYLAYPCPGDRGFLLHFGIPVGPLEDLIRSGADDGAIGKWVAAHTSRGNRERYSKSLGNLPDNPFMSLLVRLYLAGVRRSLRQTHPHLDVSAITSLGHRLCVEEGHPLPVPRS